MKTIKLQPGNIDGFLEKYPDIISFAFMPGDYYITDIVKITRKVILKGTGNKESIHLYQQNPERDGIAITGKDASGTTITGISIHTVDCPGRVALTVAGVNNTTVKDCAFYGNSDTFTVYYAGPSGISAGDETLDAYNSDKIDENNTFRENTVYSNWTGDVLSFSLQKNGNLKKNIVRGGKIAIYMCKKCNIRKNRVFDSSDIGIHVSLPCFALAITKNAIYECAASGIKLSPQGEHIASNSSQNTAGNEPLKIIIENNLIYDAHRSGIELNDVNGCVIADNTITSSDVYGIYILRSNNIKVEKNVVSYFKVAVWLESCGDLNVKNNRFISVYPSFGNNLIKTVDGNSEGTVKIINNKSFGKILNEKYVVDVKTTLKQDDKNDHRDFYDENSINIGF